MINKKIKTEMLILAHCSKMRKKMLSSDKKCKILRLKTKKSIKLLWKSLNKSILRENVNSELMICTLKSQAMTRLQIHSQMTTRPSIWRPLITQILGLSLTQDGWLMRHSWSLNLFLSLPRASEFLKAHRWHHHLIRQLTLWPQRNI